MLQGTHVKRFMVALSLGLAWGGCSRPSQDKASDGFNINVENDGIGGGKAESVAAFKMTVYPLLTTNCASCHGKTVSPFFADADVEKAWQVVKDSHLADLGNPAESRLVKRLTVQSHQCWSQCVDDGATMAAKIKEWVAKTGTGASTTANFTVQSNAIATALAEDKELNGEGGTYVMEAEDAFQLSGFMKVAQDASASKGSFIHIPPDSPPGSKGRAIYVFDVAEEGKYQLWGRVKQPNGGQRTFIFSIDESDARQWAIDVPQKEFGWEQAEANDDPNNKLFPMNLSPGTHIVQVWQGQFGSQLDMIALTKDTAFVGAGEANVGKVKVLSWDMSDKVSGKKVRFEIEITSVNEKSYQLRNPRVYVESGEVRVKGVYFLLNDVFNPQYKTFAPVDATVKAPGGEKLSGSSMIMLKDKPEDTLAVAFEILQ